MPFHSIPCHPGGQSEPEPWGEDGAIRFVHGCRSAAIQSIARQRKNTFPPTLQQRVARIIT